MAERQNTIKAITTLMLGLLCSDVMMLQVRYLLTDFSEPELSAYRNVFGIIPSLIIMLHTWELLLRKKRLPFGNGSSSLFGVLLSPAPSLLFTALSDLWS